MVEITLQLAQSPKAPTADFLATTTPLTTNDNDDDNDEHDENLPSELRLDSYTRAPWSHATFRQTNNEDEKHKGLWLQSNDGRGKLPGFVSYLKGRKKSAVGTFDSPNPDEDTGAIIPAKFWVPFDQPKPPPSSSKGGGDLVYVRYCLDGRGLKLEDTVAAAPLGPSKEQQQKQQQQQRRKQQIQKQQHQQAQQQRKETIKTKKLPPTTKSKSSFSSMLRTATTHTSPQHKKPTTNKSTSNATETITSGDVIKNLRTTIEQQLTKFDNDSLTTSLKLPISLSTHTKNLSDVEKEKVGMEIIKFLVYEQVDECGGEEKGWVSHKEAGEFMDEAVFAVYKKGCVPVDVMEDMMKVRFCLFYFYNKYFILGFTSVEIVSLLVCL